MPRVLLQVKRNNSRAMRSLQKKVTKFLYTEEVGGGYPPLARSLHYTLTDKIIMHLCFPSESEGFFSRTALARG